MKHVKFILPAIAAVTVIATAVTAHTVEVGWAIVVATVGIMLALMTVGYSITKSLQVILRRQAGLLKQSAWTADSVERSTKAATRVEARVLAGDLEMRVNLPPEVRRAYEDLTLASRSFTVPQAHFDQLLRTISANTVRTESALNNTVEELRTAVRSSQAELLPKTESAQEHK